MAVGGSGAGWNNSGNWVGTAQETPNEMLLIADCVGCHTSTSSDTIINRGGSRIPIVYNTGGYPSGALAGGNFYYVAQGDVANHAKGHNVYGIAAADRTLDIAPGGSSCGASCHDTLALENASGGWAAPGGCQGCHLDVKHHANDGTGTKYVDSADKGWYRFLSGHMTASGGVKGIEDSDWGYNADSSNHNEYLGVPTDTTNLNNGNMTAFCCGCHGDFHSSSTDFGSQSPWLRHPSDFVIPNTGEYTNAFSSGYNPNIPVARPWNFDGFTTVAPGYPSGTVTPGTDMVMCLTCHRAHASPYYKMLRWHYTSTDLSYALYGCSKCHTSKN